MGVKTQKTKAQSSAKLAPSIGKIHVITKRCKGCEICIEFCPNDVLRKSDETNERGFHFPERIPGKECIGCKRCERLCPDFAIWIEKEDKG